MLTKNSLCIQVAPLAFMIMKKALILVHCFQMLCIDHRWHCFSIRTLTCTRRHFKKITCYGEAILVESNMWKHAGHQGQLFIGRQEEKGIHYRILFSYRNRALGRCSRHTCSTSIGEYIVHILLLCHCYDCILGRSESLSQYHHNPSTTASTCTNFKYVDITTLLNEANKVILHSVQKILTSSLHHLPINSQVTWNPFTIATVKNPSISAMKWARDKSLEPLLRQLGRCWWIWATLQEFVPLKCLSLSVKPWLIPRVLAPVIAKLYCKKYYNIERAESSLISIDHIFNSYINI